MTLSGQIKTKRTFYNNKLKIHGNVPFNNAKPDKIKNTNLPQ